VRRRFADRPGHDGDDLQDWQDAVGPAVDGRAEDQPCMADLPVRGTARALTTLGDVEPVIHMLCGTDFRLSLSARIEHMFVQESAKRRCSFPGCGRPHLAKGLCRGHYEQQRAKRALQPLPSRPRGDPACSFVGCGNVAVNRGLCQAHANQRKKGQSLCPLRPFYGTQGPCRFDGCSKPRAVGGFCAGHAAQYYGGRPLAPLFKPKMGCDFPGCTKRHFALGYCQGHWRQLRLKRPLTPLRERTGRILKLGYVLIFEPTHPNAHKDGYVAEHTKVMAERAWPTAGTL
jgi:hypothetical protein